MSGTLAMLASTGQVVQTVLATVCAAVMLHALVGMLGSDLPRRPGLGALARTATDAALGLLTIGVMLYWRFAR